MTPAPQGAAERYELPALLGLLDALATPGRRVLLGIAGAPGSGKSTVAAALAGHREDAVVLPMDGFHLAQAQLDALGRADRKGAPDTFDVDGFAAVLRRVRDGGDVYVPGFDRTIEEPIAAQIRVPADAALVIVEGNYLLLDAGGWEAVAGLLDEVWFLQPDGDLRRRRLEARHVEFGRTPDEARRWVHDVDEPNAVLIAASAPRAARVIEVGEL
jgi:pantothenate kinase